MRNLKQQCSSLIITVCRHLIVWGRANNNGERLPHLHLRWSKTT